MHSLLTLWTFCFAQSTHKTSHKVLRKSPRPSHLTRFRVERFRPLAILTESVHSLDTLLRILAICLSESCGSALALPHPPYVIVFESLLRDSFLAPLHDHVDQSSVIYAQSQAYM